MPTLSSLLLFAGAAFVLLAVPGPAVVYITTRSAAHGRAAGLTSVLGAGPPARFPQHPLLGKTRKWGRGHDRARGRHQRPAHHRPVRGG